MDKRRQETLLHSPFGDFELSRYPKDNDPTLRAWSAADELLLKFLQEQIQHKPDLNLLTSNDTFGALSVCAAHLKPTLWSDSFICQQAALKNLKRNQLNSNAIHFIPSTSPIDKPIDIALLHLPKNFQYLQFQLEQIKKQLRPNGLVVAGVMVKHFHHNALQFFKDIIGETHTSLATKKARLIIAHNNGTAPDSINRPLESYAAHYTLEPADITLHTLPNVFSRDKLDIGTRVLLPQIPQDPSLQKIVDLGCGNGALGIQAARLNPDATLIFCDESYLAIKSAMLSVKSAGIGNTCEFIVTDCLANAPGDVDLILCNPPFHQQNSMHTQIAYRMFKGAYQHLKPGGKLMVVANRHLKYKPVINKLFGNSASVFSNQKFAVISATR